MLFEFRQKQLVKLKRYQVKETFVFFVSECVSSNFALLYSFKIWISNGGWADVMTVFARTYVTDDKVHVTCFTHNSLKNIFLGVHVLGVPIELTIPWLAQLVSAMPEVEGSRPRQDQHSGS